jgi:hypothetical protein
MKKLIVLAVLAGVGFVVTRLRRATAAESHTRMSPPSVPPGRDTPTGTDPDAKYERPGFEDKSLGQAVNADMDLVDRLVAEEKGDTEAAERRYDDESAGSPALARQRDRGRTDAD